jgi:hypothetical protein
LVAFFFIVLLSLGLDLAAVLPGFLLTGITHLLLGVRCYRMSAKTLVLLLPVK